jgi:hypothetical protein
MEMEPFEEYLAFRHYLMNEVLHVPSLPVNQLLEVVPTHLGLGVRVHDLWMLKIFNQALRFMQTHPKPGLYSSEVIPLLGGSVSNVLASNT